MKRREFIALFGVGRLRLTLSGNGPSLNDSPWNRYATALGGGGGRNAKSRKDSFQSGQDAAP
jgi:hypothetical protein